MTATLAPARGDWFCDTLRDTFVDTRVGTFGRAALDSGAMSRHHSHARRPAYARRSARPTTALVISLALLGAGLAGTVAAQDLPACGDEPTYDCVLSDWSAAEARDITSPFGDVQGLVWLDDAQGDAPSGGLDILGAGLGRVDIDDPGAIRDSAGLLTAGKRKKAVRRGPAMIVRVVLDRPLDQVDGHHASLHVATDIDGSRSNNAPSGIAAPDGPFAGSQDVYSLTWASTTGKERLLSSDLARKGWYRAKTPFAAAWAAPNVLDMAITPAQFGDGFRVVAYVEGEAGGYDSLSVGVGPIPENGKVDLIPTCIEGTLRAEPFLVGRMVENGQTLRNVEAPASWVGGASVPVADDSRDALAAFIAAGDDDADGRVGVPATVSLFEDGVVIRQGSEVEIAFDGSKAQLSLELGLTRRGYDVLRDVELESTADARLDTWLKGATDSLTEYLPPFRTTKKPGLLVGEGRGACVPWLEPESEPTPVASAEPVPSAVAGDA